MGFPGIFKGLRPLNGRATHPTATRFFLPSLFFHPKKKRKKNESISANDRSVRKISGAVLLSHSQIYSTIAAGALNYRVREGNVCDSSAMDTGKK